MTRKQVIQIALLKGMGWSRYSWAVLPDRVERLPLLFHPYADCKFATVETDGRTHYHCKRTPLSNEWETALYPWDRAAPHPLLMSALDGTWDGERVVRSVV